MAIARNFVHTDAIRRVTFLTDPTPNQAGIDFVLAQDNKGFQYQVSLDALPPGTNESMIQSGNQWFVENKTGIYRPTIYCNTTGAPPALAYGSFYDTTTQTGTANSQQAMKLNKTSFAYGVSVVSGSQIKLENKGIYNLQFSAQFTGTVAASNNIYIWLEQNEQAVDNTAGIISIAGSTAAALPAYNYFIEANAGDNIELYWSATHANIQLETVTNPSGIPDSPAVIVTVQQIA